MFRRTETEVTTAIANKATLEKKKNMRMRCFNYFISANHERYYQYLFYQHRICFGALFRLCGFLVVVFFILGRAKSFHWVVREYYCAFVVLLSIEQLHSFQRMNNLCIAVMSKISSFVCIVQNRMRAIKLSNEINDCFQDVKHMLCPGRSISEPNTCICYK